MTMGMRNVRSMGSGAASALIGPALVLSGAFLPWVQAESKLIGTYQAHSPSLSLAALRSSEWRYIFVALSIVGVVAGYRCATSQIARRAALLVGMLIVVATVGVFRSHGYPVSDASWGPVLTVLGGLILIGVAVGFTVTREPTRRTPKELPTDQG